VQYEYLSPSSNTYIDTLETLCKRHLRTSNSAVGWVTGWWAASLQAIHHQSLNILVQGCICKTQGLGVSVLLKSACDVHLSLKAKTQKRSISREPIELRSWCVSWGRIRIERTNSGVSAAYLHIYILLVLRTMSRQCGTDPRECSKDRAEMASVGAVRVALSG
jgi:hypothetical protein